VTRAQLAAQPRDARRSEILLQSAIGQRRAIGIEQPVANLDAQDARDGVVDAR